MSFFTYLKDWLYHRGLRAIQTKGEKSEPQLSKYESLYPRDPKSPKFEILETQNLIDLEDVRFRFFAPLHCRSTPLSLHFILS